MVVKHFSFLFAVFTAIVLFNVSSATACEQMSPACMDALVAKESGGDYGVVNTKGFLGKYQFGEAALIDAGYYTRDGTDVQCNSGCDWRGSWTGKDGITSKAQFLASTTAQDNAIKAYQSKTWSYIENLGLSKYLGQTIGGVQITCDALLAGYHLKGGGGLKTFLGSNGTNNPADGYGTRISEYLEMGSTCSGGTVNVMEAANNQSSCDINIQNTGQQLKEANMEIEKGIIDEMVQKPTSVMEGSCFDQFGEMFNQEIGKIFSDQTQGLEAFNFGGIFQDVQGKLMGELQGALFGDRAKSMGASISSKLSGAFSSIFGSGNVEYGCEVMNTLWEILQCEDMLDFNIPSIGEAVNGKLQEVMDKLMPSSCSGKALFSGAMSVAGQAFDDFGGKLPDQLNPANIENIINGN